MYGKLYREKDCHFPARCAGIEHYLKALAPKLPNMELSINTRDWPQINRAWGHAKAPVLSFSKVNYFKLFCFQIFNIHFDKETNLLIRYLLS